MFWLGSLSHGRVVTQEQPGLVTPEQHFSDEEVSNLRARCSCLRQSSVMELALRKQRALIPDLQSRNRFIRRADSHLRSLLRFYFRATRASLSLRFAIDLLHFCRVG